jgi:hypothetical protein
MAEIAGIAQIDIHITGSKAITEYDTPGHGPGPGRWCSADDDRRR